MKNLSIAPFETEDLKDIEPRDEEVWRLNNFKFSPRSVIYTARYEGKVVLIGGMVVNWPGMGEVWLICDKSVERFKKELLFTVSNFIECWIREHRLHRVQATVLKDWEAGNSFLIKLGFQKEGVLRKYDRFERDYNMYSRIRGG